MDLARAAEEALLPGYGRVRIQLGARLPDGGRSTVRRALATGPDGAVPVVLKAPDVAGEGAARELAALTVLTRRDVPGVPRLLGVADDPPLLVLSDLGRGVTLADRLLGRDAPAAEEALVAWAGALGALQAATVDLRPAFEAALAAVSPLGPLPADGSVDELAEAGGKLTRELPRLGVTASAAALDELRGIAGALDRPEASALTPADTCPDNAVETGCGTALLDFEGAQYRHVAWDAAYLRVPWPTCWCSWRLPEPVAARALERWRAAVAPAVPYVRTAGFSTDLDLASLAWVFVSMSWFIRSALAGGPISADRPMPTRRAMLQHRLGWAADCPLRPALAALAAETLDATVREWGKHPLERAPAFR